LKEDRPILLAAGSLLIVKTGKHCENTVSKLPGSLLSGGRRFLRIFVGFPGDRASNESGVVRNGNF